MEQMGSRVYGVKYNINDYLPNEIDYKAPQILQLYRRDDF